MNLQVRFDGLDHSEALIDHAQQKFDHVAEIFNNFQGPSSALLIITKTKHDYSVELLLKAKDFNNNYKRTGTDVYTVVNEVMSIAFKETNKHKERNLDDLRKNNPRPN